MSKKEIAFLKNLGVTIKKVTQTAKEIALFARPDMGLRYQLMKRSSKKQIEWAKNEYQLAEAERQQIVDTIFMVAKEKNPKRHLTKQEIEEKLNQRDIYRTELDKADKTTERGQIRATYMMRGVNSVDAFLVTAMALPSGTNIADKSGKINVKAIVIAAAGLAAAGGVAYYFMKNGVIPGDQSYVIDYENDETITIKKPDPIDIDPTKSYDENIDPSQIEQLKNNPSYIDALNNHSANYNTQLNNLTNTAKQHVINDYNLIDAAGNNSGIDERQVFGSRLMGYNDIKRALNSDGEPSENIITMLVRGKEHYESELVTSTNTYENWFVNGMQGSEMQSALQGGGYEPNYENYQDLIQCIRGITSHETIDFSTGQIVRIYSYPESDKFSQDFLSQFAGKHLLMEPIDTDTQGTTLYNEMNNNQLSLNTFNDKINTYLEHATPQSRSQIESLIADIDLTQQQYAQDVQALNDTQLAELANLQNNFVSGNSNIASNVLGDSIQSQALGSRSSNEPDVYASQQKTDFANVADGTFDQIGDTINSAMDAISSNPSALAAAITVAGVAVAGAGALIVKEIKKSHNKNTQKSKETNSIVKRISNKIHKQKAPTQTIETKTNSNSNDKQMGL